MMVSFSNDGLSGEVSNKRPLENGYVAKYKPRKVSAIRDFPPGCGRNAVPRNLNPEENGGSETGVIDAVEIINSEKTNAVVATDAGISGTADPIEPDTVGNSEMPKIVKLNEIKDSEIQNLDDVEKSNIEEERQSQEAVNSSVDVDVTDTLDALMERVMVNVNVSKQLVMEIEPIGFQFPDQVEWHKDEAINNPIELERDGPLDAYEGKVTITTTNGFSNEVEELTQETNPIGVDTLNEVKSIGDPGRQPMLKELSDVKGLVLVQNSCIENANSTLDADVSVEKELSRGTPQASSSFFGNVTPETSIRPKDKYRPRRVSAVRHFPPHCGRDVTLPIKEEKQMVMSGNDCPNMIENVELAPEATVSRNVSLRATSEQVPTTSQNEYLDGLHNIPVESETTETLNDGACGRLLEEMTGVTAEGGLMDFEKSKQPSIIERTGASPGSGTMSKAMVDHDVTNTGGPVGKEFAVYSRNRNDKDRPKHSNFSLGNDCSREIVHGLMAAQYCPWRKSKVAVKHSDGRSGLKIRQQNLSRIETPEAVSLNSNLKASSSMGPSLEKNAFPDSHDADRNPGSITFMDEGDRDTCDECVPEITPISMVKAAPDSSDNEYAGPIGTDIVVYSPGDGDEIRPSCNVFSSEDEVDREIVHGLMAAPHCPWRKGKTILSNSNEGMSGEKKRKQSFSWRHKSKAVAKKSNPRKQSSGLPSKKHKEAQSSDDVNESLSDFLTNSRASHKSQDLDVSLPPFGTNSSGFGDARNRVRETLRLFHTIYRKLLQQEEANSMPEEEQKLRESGKKSKRLDLATAKALKDKGKELNIGKMIGQVPGVEVGDEFQFRVELAVVGIHGPYQSGIDSIKVNDVLVATSIVSSGAYSDDVDNADVLIYSGQGGNVIGKAKEPEDQKLERGNLALKNCIAAQTPVRVVRGWKETKPVDPLNPRPKPVTIYVYDGLYTVKKYWSTKGPHGKQVFMFELRRNPGQPELAWKELKKSSKSKIRPGVCVADISGGKETLAIWAVNTFDEEKPPQFNYIRKMMYPDWYNPIPPAGCDCTGRCSGSKKCRCSVRNGGEIPYNRNGALVETKALVYECGPHCKCPPSCYNRVTQRGIKFQLEIFKTESRGWGVRPLTSVPSGSFICEYSGELLEEKEAEQRIGNDEYLFDIGQNYHDSSLKPEEQEIAAEAAELMEGGGFTIDACQYGNVGRFINHSCLPNLHAQNVIYDHDDKRMPHIMLFAMENIPPLQELTYHYNYKVDQICDSNGNIKVKKCYCGAATCTGRMY